MKKKRDVEWFLAYWRSRMEKAEERYAKGETSFDSYMCDIAYYKGNIHALEFVLDNEEEGE